MNQEQSRQSFLGADSDSVLHCSPVAVIGTSGGGSPICQQLAHVGFGHVQLIDPAIVEEKHRHRLMGIHPKAIQEQWHKVRVVKELMDSINPDGHVVVHAVTWQEVHELLRNCKLVFTAVDGYQTRDEIERYLRSYNVPMIDIGMDVHKCDDGHQICGQVIMSKPGGHCMRCFGYITDERLKEEVGKYGAAGFNAQVSWPNSILASTAVGMAMAYLLPWHSQLKPTSYLQYDGNSMELTPSTRLPILQGKNCPHYALK